MATTGSVRDFPLAPLQQKSWLTLVAIVAVTIAITLLIPHQELPLPARLLLSTVTAAVILGVGLAMRRRRITIEGRDLVVAAAFFTQRININALDLASARSVDLAEHTEFAPMIKLGGYDLPGFRAGGYLLRNRARAFCLLTTRDRVLVLPRHDGKFLVLSPEKPQMLLSALNELASTTARR
ncbi:PH domain-containing protein [Solilutibacter silvestris]|uniref:PH domain-containing protein n=1 Tax=Solilutibacter silvestris TaxID=1645665 RepID=UPI003D32E0AA